MFDLDKIAREKAEEKKTAVAKERALSEKRSDNIKAMKSIVEPYFRRNNFNCPVELNGHKAILESSNHGKLEVEALDNDHFHVMLFNNSTDEFYNRHSSPQILSAEDFGRYIVDWVDGDVSR